MQRSGTTKNICRRRRIGDEPIDVDTGVAKGAVEAGALVLAGDQRSAQKIDPALEASQIAVGAWIGEGAIVVVDRLAEEATPQRR